MQKIDNCTGRQVQLVSGAKQRLNASYGKPANASKIHDKARQADPKTLLPDNLLGKIGAGYVVFTADAAVPRMNSVLYHFVVSRRNIDNLARAMYPSAAQPAITIGTPIRDVIHDLGSRFRLSRETLRTRLPGVLSSRLSIGLYERRNRPDCARPITTAGSIRLQIGNPLLKFADKVSLNDDKPTEFFIGWSILIGHSYRFDTTCPKDSPIIEKT
jgi:hypothetical protein